MFINEIRKFALNEEIDYLLLTSILKKYKRPRDKITQLLKSEALVRIKKGLYIFGKDYAKKPYVIETLANLIYGPSYISLDYALAYYGMIPERVEVVTSVTNKRNKIFKTPIGQFTYRYLNPSKYPVGVTEIMIDDTHPTLFATAEKALADKIMLGSSGLQLEKKEDIALYLYEDLRLDHTKVRELDIKKLSQIAFIYSGQNLDLVVNFLKESSNE